MNQLTDAQRWILSTSGLLTILCEGDPQYFGGGLRIRHSIWAREILKKNHVQTLDDLYRNFNQNLSYIPDPLVISKSLTEDDDIVIAFATNALYPPDAGDTTYWQNRNRLGWSLMHSTHLAALAYVACMISQEEAWKIAKLTAKIFQSIFDNWDDVYKAAKSSMSIGDIDGNKCRDRLCQENGLWTLPWNTDIESVECPIEQRRIWHVSANRELTIFNKQKTWSFTDALQQAEAGDCLQLSSGVYTGPWEINKSVEIIADGANVICQAPDDAAASLVIADAFVLVRNIQFISPGGGNRGQVAIGCLSGTLLLEHISISSSGHGMSVAKPARVILFKCLLDSCALNGVVVHGILEANHSRFQHTQYHTISLDQQAYARLSHCKLSQSCTHLLGIDNGSSAYIVDSQFEHSTQAAVVITNQSQVELIRTQLLHAGLVALNAKRCFMLDSQFESVPTYYEAQHQIAGFSQVEETIILNTSFSKAQNHAVHIDQANQLRIENSYLNGGDGCGLIISNTVNPGTSSIKNAVINTVNGDASCIFSNTQAELINCTIENGMQSTALVNEKSIINFRSCQFKNSINIALLVREQSSVIANNSTFTKIKHCAIQLINAFAQFNQCSITDIQHHGLYVSGTTQVSLSQCEFKKLGQESLFADGPCMMSVQETSFSLVHPDIISLQNNAYCFLEAVQFDESKLINITLKNARLAHKNCPSLSQNLIQIKNHQSECVSLNN